MGGLEELVELFTLGTVAMCGSLGLFTLVFTCVLFTIVGVSTGVGDGGMYRVRCCDWRTYVDPVLPGVIVGVVGDMRHVESVKARVIA